MQGQDKEVTILTPASTTSKSLRTTISIEIVRQFKFKTGDKIKWNIEPREDRLIIKVEPVKEFG